MDDFKRHQLNHTSRGCGLKCPYCCGKKTRSNGPARAAMRIDVRQELADWQESEENLNNFCGICGGENDNCPYEC